jgi:hypothetical protein
MEDPSLPISPDQPGANQPASPRSSRGLVTWLVFANVALMVLAGLGLNRVYQLSRHPQATYITPAIAAEPVTLATPAPVSNVRTYQSKALGVSFSYPAQWDVSENKDEISITAPDETILTNNYTDKDTAVVGNLIINIGSGAASYSDGDKVVAASTQVPAVLPGSTYPLRYLSYFGASVTPAATTYFTALGDTGHTAYKPGQTVGNVYDLLPKVYNHYVIVAAYKDKNLACQSQPCRSRVPLATYQSDPFFTQAVDIMKTVSFHL